MSLVSANTERAKFGYLLQLSQEAIKALEMDDMNAFDRILAARRALIASFVDARAMVDSDPTLQGVVTQIQDCDKAAQRLLYRKTGQIMRSLSELQQAKLARRAYFKSGSKRPAYARADAPRFLDQKS